MTLPVRTAPATIEQVAAAAGVSRSTVSRILNGSTAVSETARDAVARAIEQLHYVPNRAARQLARRQVDAIALIVPEDIARFFSDPYFAAIVSGIHDRVARSNYVLNLFVASEAMGDRAASYLLGGNAGGAIVVSHHARDRYLDRIVEAVPVVFGGRPSSEREWEYYVDVDNIAGGRTATQHLIETGRSRIAIVTGPQDMPVGVDRLQGFRSALADAGLEPFAEEDGDFTFPGGAAAMRRILDRHGRPDAVFAASDLMARGAMTALRERGIAVPDDVAVIGFDDSPAATDEEPALTTVRQPSFVQGERMADILIGLLEGRSPEHVVILPTELVVRDTA